MNPEIYEGISDLTTDWTTEYLIWFIHQRVRTENKPKWDAQLAEIRSLDTYEGVR